MTALTLAAMLADCASPVRLMPTPVSFLTGEIDPPALACSHVLSTGVPVLYATNRGAVVEAPEPVHTILTRDRLARSALLKSRLTAVTSWNAFGGAVLRRNSGLLDARLRNRRVGTHLRVPTFGWLAPGRNQRQVGQAKCPKAAHGQRQ